MKPWRLIVVGTTPELSAQQFADAVAAALPEELLNDGSNFTQSDGFRADADYRLVMVFHGGQAPGPETLCRVTSETNRVDADAPPLHELTETTEVSAAFCQGEEVLSTAQDRVSGMAEPGQMSFTFLVEDTVRQLFPDGFQTMPQASDTAGSP